ncbi:MAG: autotransporter assembly complex protein TamA [Gammaproteobacteria bacterium]
MTLARAAAAALLAALALLAAGCGSTEALRLQPPPEPPAPPAVRLEVRAPAPLRELLEAHLDLARLHVLAPGEPVGADELDRLLAATPAQARALLETEGYFEPTIELSRDGGAADGIPNVALRIDPGERVRVGTVTVEVQGELDALARGGDARARELTRALVDDWRLSAGAPFRNAEWSAAKAAVLNRLRAEGYLTAQWSGTAAQVDVADGRARLFVVADSGPLFRTGELVIEGLERYVDDPVRHLAGFAPGTPAGEKLLIDYQERLIASRLFDGATVSVDPDVTRAAATPVTVRVREKPLQEVTAGVGYSTNVGPRTSLTHTHRKPFGWAAIVRNRVELGRKLQSWDGELAGYPGPGYWRRLVGGAYQREVADDDVTTSWRARVGLTQDTVRIDRALFAEVEQATVRGRDAALTRDELVSRTATAYSGNYHWVWRDLDDVILPTRGVSVSLQGALGWATSDYADSGAFSRLYGRVTAYRPLGGWYAQARVELGQVLRPEGVQVPDTLKFRAGGDHSVRGYDYRSLGTVIDGVVTAGNVLFTGSVEVARPLTRRMPSLWWAAFVDVGQAADRWTDLEPVTGAGLGLRWRSPVGPLSIDVAYGEAIRSWRTHLSVGVVF